MKKPKKNKPQAAKPVEKPGSASVTSGTDTTRVVRRSDGDEPTASRNAVPVLLIAFLVTLIYFGDIFVIDHGGQLDARVHQPFRSVKEFEDLQPKDPGEILRAKGQKIYNMYCLACHMGDGNGNPSAFVPPLAGSDWVAPKDPSRIIRIVLNGLQGPIMVSGKQWGTGSMVPWRDALTSDEDVAGVLTFVRASWGNKAPAVNPDDVKKIREETKGKGSSSWTADELLMIPLKE
jgi:mono/diheme cytochrome c family protein